MILRPYQEKSVEELREGYRSGATRQLLQAPTGAGKTVIFSFITQRSVEKGLKTLILTHRSEILDQISRTLAIVGVTHGIIKAGCRVDPSKHVNVASVQSLVKRFDDLPSPDFIVIDEAHHSCAGQWASVFAQYPKAKFLGVTATPERLDGRGLGDFYQRLVRGPEVQWLIDNKFLARPIYYAPSKEIDFSGVRKMAGDFSNAQTVEIVDKPFITGDMVAHYKRLAIGRKFVVFTISLEHAAHVAAEFNGSGVRAAVIDGKLTPDERRKRVTDLESGTIDGLVSCELISEGFDLPAVGCTIIARPTASLGLHLQQLGRGLRPKKDDNTTIVLDHVGNCLRHGLAEEPREWSLEGNSAKRRPKESVIETRQCKSCYAIFQGTECPQCGTQRESKAREIEIKEGELRQIEAQEWPAKRQSNIEVGRAQSYAELVAIAKARGYAIGWAFHRWKNSRNNPANKRVGLGVKEPMLT